MNKNVILRDASDVSRLAEKLSKCSEVSRHDKDQDKEGWSLAVNFHDLERSFRAFLEEQLPRLTGQDLKPTEIYDVLLEIGEEFRHIMYHIRDSRFYEVWVEQQK